MAGVVLASFEEQKGDRELFERILGRETPVHFWPSLDSQVREKILQEVSILVSWNPRWDFRPEPARIFSRMTHLLFLQLVTAGADHAPYELLDPQVEVACNPGAYSAPVAEHALALVLALAKRIPHQLENLRKRVFDDRTENRMLQGMKALVVGFGSIGRAIGRLLRAFGVSLWAINRSGQTTEPVLRCGTLRELPEWLPRADLIVLSLPLTRATRGILGKAELERIKEDAILINVARGELVDQEALFEKLVRCPNFLVGLDTWWKEPRLHGSFSLRFPFLELPNVVGSPHNATCVPSVRSQALALALENVKAFLRAKEIVRGRVDRSDYEP
ncbi:NAD(P)-dependent oxidoreductase [Candidatus Methylacidithermus pantelleriae]|uniref:Hydroxyacid dehydrogenase n=1 Tax=Candidatus Methylacidithermus pantelleriae TaxID=2744239 RepID=A0A8J2BQ04_9BACT|nr:NAD(P)-dependent oxidoreductase [Candidatus Methylacidithermus pantelleriae]CAF0698053.1 Hydroxyacid dehydrogenase [Candidatus Methylacidithermus pantelleriae]